MDLSRLENIKTKSINIKIFKTGVVYNSFPDTPYKTDIFVVKNIKSDIQYEIYAVNIKGHYEIVEITEIDGDKYTSSIHKDENYEKLFKKVSTLLSSSL